MKCYYELLEVPRDADAETIKKAYRKQALKWHPDKNPDNIDEATKYFALLQQAYETLSDNQERAWYDRHRDQILKGGFDEENYKDDSINLMHYHCKCWQSFSDEPKGFYTVYREVFEKLTEEDRDFHDDPKRANYPQFGDSNSDPEEIVTEFYGFWMSFNTVRSFTWLDEYDIRQAPNRPTMRAMEKENEKIRESARKERNEQIRDLVAFVRKKDPRVVVYREILEEKKKENEKKTEEMIRQRRLQNLKSHKEHQESEESKEAYRRQMREIEEELDAQYGGGEVESEDSDEEELEEAAPYCIVCEKSFKTIKTKENHDRSKVHKQRLAELKKHMTEEDVALLGGDGEVEKNEEEEDGETRPRGKKSKKMKKRMRRAKEEEEEEEEDNDCAKDLVEATDALTLENNGNENKGEVNIFLAAAAVPLKKEKKKTKGGKGAETDGIQLQAPIDGSDAAPKSATCDRCGEFFESRSRLFAHLKETGHATLLKMQPVGGGKKGGAKGKKGKKDREEW